MLSDMEFQHLCGPVVLQSDSQPRPPMMLHSNLDKKTGNAEFEQSRMPVCIQCRALVFSISPSLHIWQNGDFDKNLRNCF
jgi:hypothetical protein